ncbi:MAG: LysR family transcriptional regulator [Anaerosolibacter sp.]|jgi:DNA-binding transcriptional LysR family regulator|uniref:selenium metabolism-associated LysR family transcriptional regulator n=1 Tax=Anaerosolibacter sp. TaxID=1872527 RepID=UPI002623BE33|nr:selenium metabolism-associated LysR family transcriptional regulator [Anaerosolibacter sp.]MDF2547002.1 LysR family transcriptional regulator [Anaerosolibacter sp.]
MDFRQLETFVTIAKLKSFSRAADFLFLTQPTISNHIQNLEKELGTILINRSNKQITLTKAGEILFTHAMDILNKKEQTLFSLEQFKGKIEGTLEIASSSIPEQYILPILLNSFHKFYPDVRFNVLHSDSEQVVTSILNGEIDFGIVGAQNDIKHLNYLEIMEDTMLVITPYSDRYKSMDEITIEDLLQENIIMREEGSGTRKIFEQVLNTHNKTINDLNIMAYIESTESIKQCVRKGLGISILSKLAVIDEVKHNLLKSMKIKDVDIQRSFYFVFHKYRSLSPLAEAFKNFVLENKDLFQKNNL